MSDRIETTRRDDVHPGSALQHTNAIERYAKTATYEAPKIVSFPLNGLRASDVTSLTGNT